MTIAVSKHQDIVEAIEGLELVLASAIEIYDFECNKHNTAFGKDLGKGHIFSWDKNSFTKRNCKFKLSKSRWDQGFLGPSLDLVFKFDFKLKTVKLKSNRSVCRQISTDDCLSLTTTILQGVIYYYELKDTASACINPGYFYMPYQPLYVTPNYSRVLQYKP